MRNLFLFVVVALALGSLGLPGPARAQAVPPDQLFGGEVKLAVGAVNFGGSCYVNRGSSQFQRSGTSSKAVISFDEIVDSGDGHKWELRGQAVLTFTTATSGNILFSRENMLPPLTVSNPSFQNYAQTYNPVSQRLVVNFSIVFPDCTLPVFGVFEAA